MTSAFSQVRGCLAMSREVAVGRRGAVLPHVCPMILIGEGRADAGLFHTAALKHHRIHLGELSALAELADACRAADRFEFLLGSARLTIRRAFGFLSNAFAIL